LILLASVWIAGGAGKSMAKDKMENYYQSKKRENVVDPTNPLATLDSRDKEKIFKDVYSNFERFYKLLYKARPDVK